MERSLTFGRTSGWGRIPSIRYFPHQYHLPSSNNCTILDLLVIYENSMSLSFGFRHNLTIRETMEVASLLSLLEGCSFREGRRDVCADP